MTLWASAVGVAAELWSNGAITTAATASLIVGLLRWLCNSAFHAVGLEPLIPLPPSIRGCELACDVDAVDRL